MKRNIKLTLPGHPEYQSMVRLTVAAIANTMGFDVETIEDLRVCISEALNFYLGEETHIEYELHQEELRVFVHGEGEPFEHVTDTAMGKMILESLMDEVKINQEGIRFVKKIKDR